MFFFHKIELQGKFVFEEASTWLSLLYIIYYFLLFQVFQRDIEILYYENKIYLFDA